MPLIQVYGALVAVLMHAVQSRLLGMSCGAVAGAPDAHSDELGRSLDLPDDGLVTRSHGSLLSL